MKLRSIILHFALCLPMTGFAAIGAGGVDGNGGDAVVCQDTSGNITSVELLDYYEAKVNGENLRLPNNGDEGYRVQSILYGLAKWSPIRAKNYTDVYDKLVKNRVFIKGPLPDIPDSGVIELPLGCQIKQLAYQAEQGGVTKYYFSQELWDKASEETKAGIVFHELVYEEFKHWGMTESTAVRAFHRYILSADFNSLKTQQEWISQLKKIGVLVTDLCQGIYVLVDDVKYFDQDGWAYDVSRRPLDVGGEYLNLPGPDFRLAGSTVPTSDIHAFSCASSKSVKSLRTHRLKENEFFKLGGILFERSYSAEFVLYDPDYDPDRIQKIFAADLLKARMLKADLDLREVTFYQSGNVYSVFLRGEQAVSVQHKRIQAKQEILFYENGGILAFTAAGSGVLKACDGTSVQVSDFDRVLFADTGCVLKVN